MQSTHEQVNEAFGSGMMHLQTRMGHVFGESKNPTNWEVSTWCKHATGSFIEKHGTEQDKSNLPPPNQKNNPRRQPIKRNRPNNGTMTQWHTNAPSLTTTWKHTQAQVNLECHRNLCQALCRVNRVLPLNQTLVKICGLFWHTKFKLHS